MEQGLVFPVEQLVCSVDPGAVGQCRAHRDHTDVSSQLVDIFLLSLTAMFNPSLLAAVTVMLLLPEPKRLMIGYLLGAYLTSITLGLVIVFALPGTGTESTSKHTIGPIEDIVIALILFALAFV